MEAKKGQADAQKRQEKAEVQRLADAALANKILLDVTSDAEGALDAEVKVKTEELFNAMKRSIDA